MLIDVDEILRIAKKNGMNQKELCTKAGINKSTLHRIRKGLVKKNRLSTINKLVTAAGATEK